MARTFGFGILLASTAGFALAGGTIVPEIDTSTAAAAIGLLAGAVLVLRARNKRKRT